MPAHHKYEVVERIKHNPVSPMNKENKKWNCVVLNSAESKIHLRQAFGVFTEKIMHEF